MKTTAAASFVILILFVIYSTGDEELDLFNDACLNNTLCDNTTLFEEDEDIDNVHITDLVTNIFKSPNSTKVSTTTESSSGGNGAGDKKNYEPGRKNFFKKNKNKKNAKVEKLKTSFCNCDLTVGVCDINCCCDTDCTDSQAKVFSHCIEQYMEKELEDYYCHKKPFFRHNETRFILEKITDSLFCIAADNLPPVYSLTTYLPIEDQKTLSKVIEDNKVSKFKWKLDPKKPDNFDVNVLTSYKYGDVVWKVQSNTRRPLELPQTGFGKACDFKKTVKFLENWKGSCHQNNLTDRNPFLFPLNFSNFSVIGIPTKFQTQYLVQECPDAVCRAVNVSFCSESWKLCKNITSPRGFCSDVNCYNVAKRVRYTIYHSGSDGVKNVEIQFQLANVSKSFKQEIEVVYKWFGLNQSLVSERSGNPGYIASKPIFVSSQQTNKSGDEIAFTAVNKTYQYLTLPIASKNGMCSEVERYYVGFKEDLKLKCSIEVKTNNFSTSTCIKLQNRTFEMLFDFMTLNNLTKENYDRQFVSKFGNVSDNDYNSWSRIFFTKIPQNTIVSKVTENELKCSGLVTSVLINIVHALIVKPGTQNNHQILGAEVIFSPEEDFLWPKCSSKNCEESLRLELVSYVSFHDISKPMRYHIAGGPSIDISLPYDFFYPFMSHPKSSAPKLNQSIFSVFHILFIILIKLKF